MSTELKPAEKQSGQMTIRQRLESKEFKDELGKLLPKHLTPERMSRIAIAAITRTPALRDCDQQTFFQAILNLSQWGLEPDGRRAHLIPFRNTKRNCTECQLIIDYKGICELVMRSCLVSSIHADVVCEADLFSYDRGEIKQHVVDLRKPRGAVYAAYALVRMKDGSEKCEVLSREEIESVRRRSRAGNNGPWVTDWNEMAKKTCFRRLSKWLSWSSEIRDALDSDDDTIDTTVPAPRPAASIEDFLAIPAGQEIDAEFTVVNDEPPPFDPPEPVEQAAKPEPKQEPKPEPKPAKRPTTPESYIAQLENAKTLTEVQGILTIAAKADLGELDREVVKTAGKTAEDRIRGARGERATKQNGMF